MRSIASRFLPIVLLLAAALAFFAVRAEAQDISPELAEKQIAALENDLRALDDRAKADNLSPDDVRFLHTEIKKLIRTATVFRSEALQRKSGFTTLLDALGPAPDAEAQPEAPEIAERRQELEGLAGNSKGRGKRADLLIASGELMLREVTQTSRSQLLERLFTHAESPLTFDTWKSAIAELSKLARASFIDAPLLWASRQSKAEDLGSFLTKVVAFTAVLSLIAFPLRRLLLNRFGRTETIESPSYSRRLIAGLAEGVANGLFPMALVAVASLLMRESLELSYAFRTVFNAAAQSLLIFFIVWGLITAVLTRGGGSWQLTSLSPQASRSLATRLRLAAFVFVGFDGAFEAFSWQDLSQEFESVFAFVFSLALYLCLASLAQQRLWRANLDEPEGQPPAPASTDATAGRAGIRNALAVALLALPAAAAGGYPNLAIFLARAVVLSGIIVSAALLLRWIKVEMFAYLFDRDTPFGRAFRNNIGLGTSDSHRVGLWLGLLADVALLFLAVVLLLPIWGFGSQETLIWTAKLFRGVQIGSFTFSLSDALIAIGLFIAILFVTGLLKRNLERHLLPKLTKDIGIRNAFKTGVGYVGFILAALVGISALGIDLSNLALVVGALSVGIGFGLQNVVNNFVSGLILLIERPIKQGDWVIVGSHEGTVKSVNVRSTEIETFQRASVIIPNADLIASPVINWTHKDVQGRVEIAIGVAYGSDVEKVRDILLEIGRAHPMVMKTPEPQVLFRDFGASSLDFELRVWLFEIARVLIVGSELRFEIDKAFREHGIEIPFPQRVVHMTSNHAANEEAKE